MENIEFVFGYKQNEKLESIIENAKKELVIISPYIDLAPNIKSSLIKKREDKEFKITILFGKSKGNYAKSFNIESQNFFKGFPNIEIRYNERLHAKFYRNEFSFLMSSMNFYNYSLDNNIESGIFAEFDYKSHLGKAIGSIENLANKGINKISTDVLGLKKSTIDPIKEFNEIINESDILFKQETKPKNEGALKNLKGSIFGNKQYHEPETIDNLSNDTNDSENNKAKLVSISKIAKSLSLKNAVIQEHMEKRGLINDNIITDLGATKGLQMLKFKGKEYIAYPENLDEIRELENRN